MKIINSALTTAETLSLMKETLYLNAQKSVSHQLVKTKIKIINTDLYRALTIYSLYK
jgi:hypothetical protein